MKEIFAVIATGILISVIPNFLENKHINIKIPKLINSLLFCILALLSMTLIYFGFYEFNLLFLIIGSTIYYLIVLFLVE